MPAVQAGQERLPAPPCSDSFDPSNVVTAAWVSVSRSTALAFMAADLLPLPAAPVFIGWIGRHQSQWAPSAGDWRQDDWGGPARGPPDGIETVGR